MKLNAKTATVAGVFVSWIVLTSVGLFYFANQNFGVFDKDNNWQHIAVASFTIGQLDIAPANGKQVVHVQQTDCSCNSKADLHIAKFSTEYKVATTAQFQHDVRDIHAAGLALPASPAVLIFEDGQLIYAGPYASGPLCSVNESLIAPILLAQVTLPGLWLNGQVKACRCLFTPV